MRRSVCNAGASNAGRSLCVQISGGVRQSEPRFPGKGSSHCQVHCRVKFLSSVIELFLSLTVEALQGKTRQNSLPSGGGTSLGAKISGARGRPWGIFFGFYKTRHILLSDSVNCSVLRAVVFTQYRRVTDGRTDRQTELP